MFPGLQRFNRDALVPVVGSRDDYRVHILARQNFAVIPRGEQIRAPQLASACEAAIVDVAHRHQLHSGDRSRVLGIATAHAAYADGGDLNI